jgi:hypothetical protein
VQQLVPGDGAVVLAVETDAGQACGHRLVLVGQQALAVRQAGQQGEVGLGDAEGDLGLVDVAPGRDLAPVLPHHAGRSAARMHRPAQPVVGRRVVVVHAPGLLPGCRRGGGVARPRGFVGLGKADGGLQEWAHGCGRTMSRQL